MYIAALILCLQLFVVIVFITHKQRQIRTLQIELSTIRNQKFGQLYRLATLGKSTLGTLHDIANPITCSIMLIEQGKHKNLSYVYDALMLVSKIIHNSRGQLLSGAEALAFSPFDEIYNAIEFLEHKRLKQQVKCRVSGDSSVKIVGDKYKFYQCISNLLSNAIDAYVNSNSHYRTVEISLSKFKESVRICITDFGCGIAKEHYSHIFTPFFSTKNINDGTGIGLVETKQFIEEYFHGTISFESALGEGTTFTLLLPSSLPSQTSYATLDT